MKFFKKSKSKKFKPTKREKAFFIITLIAVTIAIGAIVHAQTSSQGHDWSEITCNNCLDSSSYFSKSGIGDCSNICTDQDTHLSEGTVQDYAGATAGTHLTYDTTNNKLNAAWPSLSCTTNYTDKECKSSFSCHVTAYCPSGYTLTGGGCIFNPDEAGTSRINPSYDSYPLSTNGWLCQIGLGSGESDPKDIKVWSYARCCKLE